MRAAGIAECKARSLFGHDPCLAALGFELTPYNPATNFITVDQCEGKLVFFLNICWCFLYFSLLDETTTYSWIFDTIFWISAICSTCWICKTKSNGVFLIIISLCLVGTPWGNNDNNDDHVPGSDLQSPWDFVFSSCSLSLLGLGEKETHKLKCCGEKMPPPRPHFFNNVNRLLVVC